MEATRLLMSAEIHVRRARREDLIAIVELVQASSGGQIDVDEAKALEWLLSKGLLVALRDERLLGMAAWQAENLLAVTDAFCLAGDELETRVGQDL